MDEGFGRENVATPPPDPRHDKWVRWHEEIRERIISEIYLSRFFFRGIQRIIRDHGSLPDSPIFEFIAVNYVRSQAVAVRAEIDNLRSDVVTLGRLLVELRDDAEVVTRERYVARYPTGVQWVGDREFTEVWAGTVGAHLDPAIIEADLAGMHSGATSLVRHYVNKEIAHHDEIGALVTPTFDDLDAAIDNLGALLTRYGTLLTGSTLGVVEPVVQFDWEAPFREPWIRSPD